jgi:hypothetical protein
MPAIPLAISSTEHPVLRLQQGRHKLSSPCDGSYIIAEVLKSDMYKLANDEVFTNT